MLRVTSWFYEWVISLPIDRALRYALLCLAAGFLFEMLKIVLLSAGAG